MELVEVLPSYPHLFGSATASAIITSFHVEEQTLLPSENHDLPKELCLGHPWEKDKEIDFTSEEISDFIRFQTIQNFATKLLENAKDINPEFAKIASEHFWDLV